MDTFLAAVTWHHEAFLRTATGDFYRVCFEGGHPAPLMQRLNGDEPEYSEPIAALKQGVYALQVGKS